MIDKDLVKSGQSSCKLLCFCQLELGLAYKIDSAKDRLRNSGTNTVGGSAAGFNSQRGIG